MTDTQEPKKERQKVLSVPLDSETWQILREDSYSEQRSLSSFIRHLIINFRKQREG